MATIAPSMKAVFAAEHDVPVPYMQRTRDYYLALGFAAYRWAHFVDAPFAPLRIPLSQARVLSAAGIGAELEDVSDEPLTAQRAADRNAIARLIAPGGMGESIRVLLASRGSRVKDTLLAWPEVVHSH